MIVDSLERIHQAAQGFGQLETPTPENQQRIKNSLEELHTTITDKYEEAVTLGFVLLRKAEDAAGKKSEALVEEFRSRLTHGGLAEDIGKLSDMISPACM